MSFSEYERQSSGKIQVSLSDSDFHIQEIKDQFLIQNPKSEQILNQMRYKLMPNYEMKYIIEDGQFKEELETLQQEEERVIKKRNDLIKTIEALSHQKRVLIAQLQIKQKIEQQKQAGETKALQQFKSNQMFKFITIDKPITIQNNPESNLQQEALTQLLSQLASQLNSKIQQQKQKQKQLISEIQQIKKKQLEQPKRQPAKMLITYEQQIKQRQDYLKRLKEKNKKLEKYH